MSHLNHFHHEISQLYYILQALLKTRSYHGEIILLQVPKYFIYPKSQICITRLLKIILNVQLITTSYNYATFVLTKKHWAHIS